MEKQKFPLIVASGSSYEMGYQHGAQASELIEKYLLWIERQTGKSRDVLCRNAMLFQPLIESLSTNLMDEVRGLSEGAKITLEEALLCQARGEAAREVSADGCTAFAVTKSATADGNALAGQNQDLPPEFGDVGIVLHLKPSDGRPRVVMFTFAGQLGYAGMNSNGVAHFANGLYNCPWRPALPHYPLKRIMFEQENLTQCVEVLEAHPACSAGNMVFCSGSGEIADVEIRSDGVSRFFGKNPDILLHTNHYLTDAFQEYEDNTLADSCPRLDRIGELVEARLGEITVDTMKGILADHSGDPAGICRHGEKGMHSVSGYIAEPAKGVLHVRRGHGCLGSWVEYEV